MAARADRFDEQLPRTTVDVARIDICFIDPDRLFVYANRAFCVLSRFCAEALIGRQRRLAASPAAA